MTALIIEPGRIEPTLRNRKVRRFAKLAPPSHYVGMNGFRGKTLVVFADWNARLQRFTYTAIEYETVEYMLNTRAWHLI